MEQIVTNTSDAAKDHIEKSGGGEKSISKGWSSFLTDKLITLNHSKSTNLITKDIWRKKKTCMCECNVMSVSVCMCESEVMCTATHAAVPLCVFVLEIYRAEGRGPTGNKIYISRAAEML